MKKLNLFSVLLLLPIFCYSQSFERKNGGHCYSMEIPAYMSRTYELNDVASLQYQSLEKDVYLVVIEDVKEHLESLGMVFSNAREFLDFFLEDYNLEASNREIATIIEFESNGYGHAQTTMTWGEEGDKLYMLITTVETSTHFYKILCWTTLANKTLSEADFIRISKTLKD